MTDCNLSCSSCSEDCNERREGQPDPLAIAKANPDSHIKKVIAVMSGKGGVGKSMVTAQIAAEMARRGYQVGIMDGDITGPSIPKMLGITERAQSDGTAFLPVKAKGELAVMSLNLVVENEEDPIVVRGPIIAGTIRQFWTDVAWGELDYLFVDMPPGTGDVALAVMQNLPVDGIIVVTSPQELVKMIVGKAIRMAKMLNKPVLGLIENYSYLKCPECGKQISVFGESHIDKVAAEYDLKVLGKIPIDPAIAEACDNGKAQFIKANYLDNAAELLEGMLEVK